MFFYCATELLILTRRIMKYYVSNADVIQCVSLPEMPVTRERDANDDDHYLRESGHCRHAV
ncbi:conserved hypothetical protein [Agrobacterium sp. NCPPB 925]|nr:conserved hypothetical protein [Agrobacterium sp. NCPPB 925]